MSVGKCVLVPSCICESSILLEVAGYFHQLCRDFDGNELTEIVSSAFAGSFRTVTLSNNRIVRVEPGAFAGVQEFASIELESNNLVTIPEGVFTSRYRTL